MCACGARWLSPQDGERKVRGRQLVRKALADQARELCLVIQGEQTGDDAAGAVS
jgi:hypothetical protein